MAARPSPPFRMHTKQKPRQWQVCRSTTILSGSMVPLTALASTFCDDYFYCRLSWGTLSPEFVEGLGGGCLSFLYGLQVCYGPANDKPDTLTGVVRKLAGLPQQMAALCVHRVGEM